MGGCRMSISAVERNMKNCLVLGKRNGTDVAFSNISYDRSSIGK